MLIKMHVCVLVFPCVNPLPAQSASVYCVISLCVAMEETGPNYVFKCVIRSKRNWWFVHTTHSWLENTNYVWLNAQHDCLLWERQVVSALLHVHIRTIHTHTLQLHYAAFVFYIGLQLMIAKQSCPSAKQGTLLDTWCVCLNLFFRHYLRLMSG